MSETDLEAVAAGAASAHAAGNLAEAETMYRRVLAVAPGHAGALHGLGLIAAQTGHGDAALELLGRAVEAEPGRAEWIFHLALVHLHGGRSDEARRLLERVIAIEPGFPDAYNALGVALRKAGDVTRAVESYRRALSLRADFPEAANNLGSALLELGKTDDAIAAFRRAISGRPDYAEALSNLASALRTAKQSGEALMVLWRASGLRPGSAEIQYNLGLMLQDEGKFPEAEDAYRRALSLRPDYVQAMNNLGNVLHEMSRFEEAVVVYARALALRPDLADAHNNLGRALRELGRIDEAIAAYQRAVSLRGDFVEARRNLGNALVQTGEVETALDQYGQALSGSNRANLLDAQWNYALALLLRGDFEKGWELYEVRNRRNAGAVRPDLLEKMWDGSDLNGRTILLLGEQGLGDTIHFVRYAPMVAARGGKVLLYCQPPLARLMRGQRIDAVITTGDPLPAFDVCCPLMSLPHLFNTRVETIPADVPYLKADEERTAYWSRRLADIAPGLRVGLVWAGSPTYGNDKIRSITLATLAPLGAIRGVNFVSLQKGPAAAEAKEPPLGMRVAEFTDELTDFAETAALVANLDLAISVDTAVAHLAGAMAKPVWTLLPFAPDWRWRLGRNDSDWYPTMRLFRQPVRGDWASVVAEVAGALRNFTGQGIV